MNAQALSRRTIDERTSVVVRSATWCGKPPDVLQSDDIVEWLAEGGTWVANTHWTYCVSLNAWFTWLKLQEHRIDNPMDKVGKPRRPRNEPHPVSDHGMRRILRSPMRNRSRAAILLAAFEGLRVHEIAKIKGDDVDLIAQTLTVTGKGGVRSTLPLHHLVLEQAFKMPRKGYWFPGVDHGHQRRESISDTIKEVMVRAGVPGSAHWLRHYFGTALVRAGVDLRTVQTLMRHSSLQSTAIYTQISDEQRATGIQRLDPFGVGGLRPPAAQPAAAAPPGDITPLTPDDLRRRASELMSIADRLSETEPEVTWAIPSTSSRS